MFVSPRLPYDRNALEPHISKETIIFHYEKHYRNYINSLNSLIIKTSFEESSLERIIFSSKGLILDNASQVWNHTFYWNCLSPKLGQKPAESLLSAINYEFGFLEELKKALIEKTVNLLDSVWIWLVKNKDSKLEIKSTSNTGCPIRESFVPLPACDTWEHACSMDYTDNRKKYIEAFWRVINWDFVSKQCQATK